MPVAKKKTKAKRRRTRAPAAPDLSHIVEGLRPLAIPLAKLKTDPKNARAHSDRNLEALRYSLEQFGQHRPIVVQRKGLVVRAGNALLAVAKELGFSSRGHALQ